MGCTFVGHFRRLTSSPSRTQKSFECIFVMFLYLSFCSFSLLARLAIFEDKSDGVFALAVTLITRSRIRRRKSQWRCTQHLKNPQPEGAGHLIAGRAARALWRLQVSGRWLQ
jgi:hypothetical protein